MNIWAAQGLIVYEIVIGDFSAVKADIFIFVSYFTLYDWIVQDEKDNF